MKLKTPYNQYQGQRISRNIKKGFLHNSSYESTSRD